MDFVSFITVLIINALVYTHSRTLSRGIIWIINIREPSGWKFAPLRSRIYSVVKLPRKVPIPNPFGWTDAEMLSPHLILVGGWESLLRQPRVHTDIYVYIYEYFRAGCMLSTSRSRTVLHKTRKLRTRSPRTRNRAFPLKTSFNIVDASWTAHKILSYAAITWNMCMF